MEFSVQNLCGFLIRSRLLSPEEVKGMYQRWQEEAGDNVQNVAQFGRWLVTKQYVTEYQASLLARGLPDNFFLDQYKILDRVGRGAMAGVYKAVHSLGQVVAIKVLPPSKAKDPRLLGRFEREARMALRLQHPNIVRTFQMGQAEGLRYLVMEYLEGETLEEVLKRRGRLPPEEGVRLIHQTLLGLQHIHEQELVHRDLKPANLMVVPAPAPGQPDTTLQATVKILDIGLVKPLSQDPEAENSRKHNFTGLGMLLGTPDYLAPEQARNPAAADIRSDIYSVGCVLYQVLAGQLPFPDTNILTQMVRHQNEVPRRLKELNPAVPDGLQQIIDWMMAKDPSQRYPTPERAAQALQVYLAAGASPPLDPEKDPKTRLYLNWLEENRSGDRAAVARVPLGPTQVVKPNPPASAVPAPRGAKAAREKASGKRSRSHARKERPAAGTAAPRSAPGPGSEAYPMAAKAQDLEDMVDVELVPIPPPSAVVMTLGKDLALTRRDLLMVGIGAGSLTAAIGLGYGAARLGALLFRKRRNEESDQ